MISEKKEFGDMFQSVTILLDGTHNPANDSSNNLEGNMFSYKLKSSGYGVLVKKKKKKK
jgi:hypothetical protein